MTAVDSTRFAAGAGAVLRGHRPRRRRRRALEQAVAELNAVPGEPGYVTETFCERSRFFQPANGARIDAVRARHRRGATRGSWLEPVLLTSLLEAADRVDSTTGVQMAYVKQWADRSFRPLELRVPELLLPGPGRAVRGDACAVVAEPRGRSTSPISTRPTTSTATRRTTTSGRRSWPGTRPTTTGWRASGPRSATGERSAFNSRRTMPDALAQVVRDVRARLLVLSYNDESWMGLDELVEMCRVRGHVEVLAFASNRYVGARIGIHNPAGERVGIGRAASGTSSTSSWPGSGTRSAMSSSPGATRWWWPGRADAGVRSVPTVGPTLGRILVALGPLAVHCLTPPSSPVNVGCLPTGARAGAAVPARIGRVSTGGGCRVVAGQWPGNPRRGTTWERSKGGWRSSRVPGAASAVSTPCCSPPKAPRSS